MPSNDLDRAGVVMKVFDPCNDYDEPWSFTTYDAYDIHCPDRISVTIVRQGWPKICTCMSPFARTPGFVFSSAVDSRISCSYRADTATTRTWRQCEPVGGDGSNDLIWGCVPGCHGAGVCESAESDNGECLYGPGRLQTMLEAQDLRAPTRHLADYNEIILDTYNHPWTDLFPSVVVAVFYQARCSPEEQSRAYDVRRRFCAAFALRARCVPVLEYDELRSAAPFDPPDEPPLPPPLPPAPPLPPVMPEGCQDWCADNDQPWEAKCAWRRFCWGCIECAQPNASSGTRG